MRIEHAMALAAGTLLVGVFVGVQATGVPPAPSTQIARRDQPDLNGLNEEVAFWRAEATIYQPAPEWLRISDEEAVKRAVIAADTHGLKERLSYC